MKFIITFRGLILPSIAGTVLLLQNWIPGALYIFALINIVALVLLTADYFSLPGPAAFRLSRFVADRLYLHKEEDVRITVSFNATIALAIDLYDLAPAHFTSENPSFSFIAKRGPQEHYVCYRVNPLLRGSFVFEGGGMRIRSLFGLAARQFTVSFKSETSVYPSIPTQAEELQSLFYMSRIESHIMHIYGPGREYSQLRDYQHGDDRRAIHWKRTAATSNLVVKEFQPEKGQNVFLMIDGGRLMMAELGNLSKVDWALSSSFSLARKALSDRDSVGMMGFTNQIDLLVRPSNRQTQNALIANTMYGFQPKFTEPDYGAAFRWAYANLSHRCIIIVYTDFIDPGLSRELGAHIRFLNRKHRVICCALGLPGLDEIAFRKANSLRESVFSAVVREGIDSRKEVLQELKRAGVDIIDTTPDQLGGAVLSHYAKMRWKS